jgi:hypothetical protein
MLRPDAARLAGNAPFENRRTHVTEQVGQASSKTDPLGLTWVKSSASGSGGDADCVETAATPERVFLRDSKSPQPSLSFTHEAWKAFLAAHS